jgi:hypothetical protein
MRHLPILVGCLGLAVFLGACSSSATPAPAAPAGYAQAPAPAWGGGYAFAQRDAPYEQVLASARQTGRPAVLFFWTSW